MKYITRHRLYINIKLDSKLHKDILKKHAHQTDGHLEIDSGSDSEMNKLNAKEIYKKYFHKKIMVNFL